MGKDIDEKLHSPEAECALLGSIMLDWSKIDDVVGIIKDHNDFYSTKNGTVYRTMVAMYDKDQVGDIVLLRQNLADKGILEDIGGVDRLVYLMESVPSSDSAIYYAEIVRDKAQTRFLYLALKDHAHRIHESPKDAMGHLQRLDVDITEIASEDNKGDSSKLASVLDRSYDYITSDTNTFKPIGTGWDGMDRLIGGLMPDKLYIVAGRPSMGKSMLALNLAQNAALRCDAPAAFFSLEMSPVSVGHRIMASEATVDLSCIINRSLTGVQYESIQSFMAFSADKKLFIEDTPGITLAELKARSRQLVDKHGVKLIVVDYLQLMKLEGGHSREQDVGNASRELKELSRNLHVPVVCVAQLNRGVEQRISHRPRMSDLRESGSIEQDADVIMLVHREDYYNKGTADYKPNNEAEIIIAKQRDGETGTVDLKFEGPIMKFYESAFKGY